MNFNIVEKYIQGKSPDFSKCEDKIIISNDFVCLVDGATSKSDMTFNQKSQGVIAGELIENILNRINKKISVFDFIDKVNDTFTSFYINNDLTKHMDISPVDRLNASVIIYSVFHKEIWLIGDCQALIDNKKITNSKLVDDILSNLRAFVIDCFLKSGKTIDELIEKDLGRDKIMPFLKNQSIFQNNHHESEYSYAVLDGYPIDRKQIRVFDVSNSKTIVLATDGYPEIYTSLGKTEKYLKLILEKDPLCYSIFKSTKGLKKGNLSFDDRAYVKIEI